MAEWKKDISVSLICPECMEDPPNVVENFSEGNLVCASCGLVVENRIIDTRSEWRTFSNDDQNNDDPSRVGEAGNPLLDNNRLTTTIAFGGGGIHSRDLHRAQARVNANDKTNKQLQEAYRSIGELCDGWQLPRATTEYAKHLYKIASDKGTFRSKPMEAVTAGVIFIACRSTGVPRTFREVFALTKVPKKEIGKVFKQLEALFKNENEEKRQKQIAAGYSVNPGDMLPSANSTQNNAVALLVRYTSQLGLDALTSKVAREVAEKMDREGILAGRSPLSQCAASLYFASHLMGQPKTSMDISKILGISDGTIRTVYKVLYQSKDKLIDPNWIEPQARGKPAELPSV